MTRLSAIIILSLLLGLPSAQAQDDGAVNDSLLRVLELEEVEVTAQKPIVKMTTDKIAYDVTQDADARSQTILDLLRKVPMVIVDGQDNITVNGSSSFKVYVDGKPNPMLSANPSQIFKAMPAAMVKEIEVVTNPGAKYDAEGAGGILNIKMNKQLMQASGQEASVDGVNGNVRLAGGNLGYGAAAFLNGQCGRLSFSGNGIYNKQMTDGMDVLSIQEQLGDNPSRVETRQDDSHARRPMTFVNASLGYELDSVSSINATVGFNRFQAKSTGRATTAMTGGIYSPGIYYAMDSRQDQWRSGLNLSADYQRFFNADRTRSLTLTYLFSHNPSANESTSLFDHTADLPAAFAQFVIDRYSDSRDRTNEHTAQADFTSPLSDVHTLNVGAKFTSFASHADADYFLGNEHLDYQPALSSEYKNGKRIAAAYAEHEGKYGVLSSRLGLRYEHTWQSVDFVEGKGEDFSNHYGNFIPSLSISYSPVMFANIGLTYNLRISRPGLSYLNPYVDRTVNTALTYGNPDLDVETTHNVGLVMNLFTPKIMANVNLRYAHSGNGIEQYSFFRDNLLHTTYGNIVVRNVASASAFVSWLLHKNTRLMANLGLTHSSLSSEQLDRKSSGWQSNIMTGVQQTLPWKTNLSVFVISNSKTRTLQGSTSGFGILAANLTKSFCGDKFNLSLQAVTGLAEGGAIHFETKSQGHDFRNSTSISIPLASAQLTLTYNFGNSKVKVRQHKTKVSNDLIEQRSSMEQINDIQQMK